MDDKELYERGLKLRVDMFGREAVEKRMNALGDFGKPLQHIINAYSGSARHCHRQLNRSRWSQ